MWGKLVHDMILDLWYIFFLEICAAVKVNKPHLKAFKMPVGSGHVYKYSSMNMYFCPHHIACTRTHTLYCRLSSLSVCSFSYFALASAVGGPQSMIKGGLLKWPFSSQVCGIIFRYNRNPVVFSYSPGLCGEVHAIADKYQVAAGRQVTLLSLTLGVKKST